MIVICNEKNCIFAVPKKTDVSVAQQVEHIPFKDGVLGSNPSWNTKSRLCSALFFMTMCLIAKFFLYLCRLNKKMDMDIIITIIIIAVLLASEYVKEKKKRIEELNKAAQKKAFSETKTSNKRKNYRENFSHENEIFENNSSKSQPYFTYESVSAQDKGDGSSKPPMSETAEDFRLQEVENEIETCDINLHDPEELRKAVLYGEILKNPYN